MPFANISDTIMVGGPIRHGGLEVSVDVANSGQTLDAANEAVIYAGHLVWADGGSHTVSSAGGKIGWRCGSALTWANGTSRLKVGIGGMDAANGPPARMTNSSNVITFDVSDTINGATVLAASTWIESAMDSGTKTIAHGDYVGIGIQLTVRGGSDAVEVEGGEGGANLHGRPSATSYLAASYSNVTAGVPNVIVIADDGTIGWLAGSLPGMSALTSLSFDNGTAIREAGNLFSLPVAAKIDGVYVRMSIVSGGDFEVHLYSDPLGTPVSEKSVAVDSNQLQGATTTYGYTLRFSSPYYADANEKLVIAIKPTTTNNVAVDEIVLGDDSYQAAWQLGTACYEVSRGASGAFAVEGTGTGDQRAMICALVSALDSSFWPVGNLGV